MIECLSAAECAWWLRQCAGQKAALRVDSRLLEAGDVFVALKGAKADGLSFAPVAAARRAAALICDKRPDVLEKCAGLPCVQVENLHEKLGVIASL